MASTLITVPALGDTREGIRHFFGTRRGPAPPQASRTAPIDPGSYPGSPAVVVSVEQVHGTDALLLDGPVRSGQSFPGGWDALVTNQPAVLLTIRTADCVPVLIHDPVRRVVAAIHAGWRGAIAGIVPKTLERMTQRFRSDPTRVRIGIGPSI